jgi:hypothetical protein
MKAFYMAAGLLMLVAVGHWPYGFYQLVRVVGTVAAAALATRSFGRRNEGLAWLCVGLALMLNPISPVHMARAMWQVVDVVAGVVFVASAEG